MSDPAKYRKREEVKDMRQHHDPINMLKDRLIDRKLMNEEESKKIQDEVFDVIEQAANKALENGEPDSSALMTDIYVEENHAG